jgi:hypothetical protein
MWFARPSLIAATGYRDALYIAVAYSRDGKTIVNYPPYCPSMIPVLKRVTVTYSYGYNMYAGAKTFAQTPSLNKRLFFADAAQMRIYQKDTYAPASRHRGYSMPLSVTAVSGVSNIVISSPDSSKSDKEFVQ